MNETVKRWLPLAIGIVVAVVCGRLGLWQLDRLAQRQTRNAEIERQLAAPPVIALAAREATRLAYRRATLHGRFDFRYEQVVVLRPRDGVPGVHVATPLQTSESTAILVERGWVASPDGKTVDLAALSEPESTTVAGYLMEADRGPEPEDWPTFVRHPDPALVSGRAAPSLVLRRTELPSGAPTGLRPMEFPALTNGPHVSYAIQWFAFGVIAVVGSAVLVISAGRGKRERGSDVA